MAGDLVTILGDATTVGSALGYLNLLPPAVKERLISGCNFIIGRGKRRFDVRDKREDAEIADEEKRAGNKTTAEQKVLDTLVPDIAKRIAGDEALMGRALVSVMGEAYRKQENKEAVVEECLKDIGGKEGDVSSNLDPIDEDWLDIFSSYAEKANTERTRQLWGRILSGEVRKPGSISLTSLRIISEVDRSTAEFFTSLMPIVLGDCLYVGNKYKSRIFDDLLMLEATGLVSGVQGNFFKQTEKQSPNIFLGGFEKLVAYIKVLDFEQFNIPCITLTKSGRELMKVIGSAFNVEQAAQSLIDTIPKEHIFEIKVHEVIRWEIDGPVYKKQPIKEWVKKK